MIEVTEVDESDKGYSRYVAFVKLIHLNYLNDNTTSLLLSRLVDQLARQPVGWPEIAMYGGCSHNLKNLPRCKIPFKVGSTSPK